MDHPSSLLYTRMHCLPVRLVQGCDGVWAIGSPLAVPGLSSPSNPQICFEEWLVPSARRSTRFAVPGEWARNSSYRDIQKILYHVTPHPVFPACEPPPLLGPFSGRRHDDQLETSSSPSVTRVWAVSHKLHRKSHSGGVCCSSSTAETVCCGNRVIQVLPTATQHDLDALSSVGKRSTSSGVPPCSKESACGAGAVLLTDVLRRTCHGNLLP